MIQANAMFLNNFQSTFSLERTLPTATTEPTLQCVELIGMPIFDAISTVKADPISIQKPLQI
jgi:hypothetical protein